MEASVQWLQMNAFSCMDRKFKSFMWKRKSSSRYSFRHGWSLTGKMRVILPFRGPKANQRMILIQL
jgi:hypothetical protein